MAGNIKGITIEIGGNTTPLQKALSGVNKSIKDTQKQLKEVDKLLKVDPKNTELLRQKQELLNKAVSETKDKLDKEKEALKQLAAQDQTPEVTEKMNQLKRAIVEDEQALKSANKELKNFGSVGKQQAQAFGKELQEVGKKVSDVGSKVKGVGDSLTTHVTAPIVALGGASLAAFNEVDKGYDIVIQKTGAVGASAQGMYDIVDQLATSIPTDFETAGSAVGEVNTRFGLTGHALERLSGDFIKFAKLNNTDVSSSVDEVQKALSAFGLGAGSAEALLNQLNATGQATGVSVDTLTSGLIQNGTAFQEMGLDINQSVAMMGELEKSGANGETVMQGLRKALKSAAKDGKPLNEALAELQDKIENGSEGMDGLTAAYEVFGKSGDQIYSAIKNGSLDFRNLGDSAGNVAGSINSTFKETLSPMDEWAMTLNELKLAGADLGATLGEILLPIIQQAGDVVQSLREKWESLSPEQQKLIEQVALAIAVIGPVVSLIGSIIMGIGGLITAVGTITTTLGIGVAAFGGIVAAIAAVIAIIIVCITHWDQIKAKVKEVWESISTYMANLKESVSTKWEEIKQNVAEKIQSIKTDLQEKWAQIKSDAVQKIEDTKSSILQKFTDIKDGIKKKIEDIKGFFSNLKLKFPEIEMPKLPHFSLSGEFSLNPPSVPHLDIDWYAKAMNQPYYFSSPTVMQTPYGLLGAGEAGGEFMYGKNSLMNDIQNATAANNEALIDGMYAAFTAALQQADIRVEINEREFGRIVREARA